MRLSLNQSIRNKKYDVHDEDDQDDSAWKDRDGNNFDLFSIEHGEEELKVQILMYGKSLK